MLLLALNLGTFIITTGQQQIDFKIGYRPGKTYHQNLKSSQVVTNKFNGPESLLKDLKAKGDSAVKSTHKEVNVICDIQTFKELNDKGEFDFEMNFEEMNLGNDSSGFPGGIKFLGKMTMGSAPRFDSIIAEGLDAAVQKQVFSVIKAMFSQLTFPEKKQLKKGESFIHELPVTLPVGNKTLLMNVITKYTLMAIHDGMANLAVSQTYTVNATDTAIPLEIKGDGEGELYYDIDNGYYRSYQLNLSMVTHIKNDKVDLTRSVKSYSEQLVTITNN